MTDKTIYDINYRSHCPKCGQNDNVSYDGMLSDPDTNLWHCLTCKFDFETPVPKDPDTDEYPSRKPGTAGD